MATKPGQIRRNPPRRVRDRSHARTDNRASLRAGRQRAGHNSGFRQADPRAIDALKEVRRLGTALYDGAGTIIDKAKAAGEVIVDTAGAVVDMLMGAGEAVYDYVATPADDQPLAPLHTAKPKHVFKGNVGDMMLTSGLKTTDDSIVSVVVSDSTNDAAAKQQMLSFLVTWGSALPETDEPTKKTIGSGDAQSKRAAIVADGSADTSGATATHDSDHAVGWAVGHTPHADAIDGQAQHVGTLGVNGGLVATGDVVLAMPSISAGTMHDHDANATAHDSLEHQQPQLSAGEAYTFDIVAFAMPRGHELVQMAHTVSMGLAPPPATPAVVSYRGVMVGQPHLGNALFKNGAQPGIFVGGTAGQPVLQGRRGDSAYALQSPRHTLGPASVSSTSEHDRELKVYASPDGMQDDNGDGSHPDHEEHDGDGEDPDNAFADGLDLTDPEHRMHAS